MFSKLKQDYMHIQLACVCEYTIIDNLINKQTKHFV